MTVMEFYKDLLRGKGSCYHALREAEDKSRYQSPLMNAATRSTAFDPQCEGTRAPYIYELLLAAGDPRPYLAAAIKEFKFASLLREKSEADDEEEANCAHNPTPNDDDFYFLAELLALFAEDGSPNALSALIAEYDALFLHLLHRKERPDLFFPERDAFERLAITLCDKYLADPITAVRDVGRILRDNPIYESYDFDEFHDLVAHNHRQTLKTMIDDSAILAYLKIYYPDFCRDPENTARSQGEEDMEDLIFTLTPPSSPAENVRLYHAPRHSKLAEEANDPTAFMAMVDYYQDANRVEDALLALSKMRHPKLRKWALDRLESAPARLLPIVMKNYEEEDHFEVVYELKQVEVDGKDMNGWHGVHLALLDMEKDGLTPPHEALAFVYRHSYCSNCRQKALQQLHRAKMLTADMMNEALYDCSLETREFIRSLLR